jgi:hypothetical protein
MNSEGREVNPLTDAKLSATLKIKASTKRHGPYRLRIKLTVHGKPVGRRLMLLGYPNASQ